jgi:serine phosphatase RsbU (regulator of sigma subunit)
MCAAPVIAGDRRLGALRFSFDQGRLFDEEERRFVLALAAQTAQALDRAELHQRRIELSHRFQRALLPPSLPDVGGFELAAVYHPLGDGMDLGGDFYDLWRLPDGGWGLAIGDAAGTGPEAAALTAMVRFTVRALSVADRDPSSILAKLNRTMLDAGADGELGERFCTALVGVASPGAGGATTTLLLAGGGHPHPLLRRAGEVHEVTVGGTLLGALADPAVHATEVVLHPGDTLVLYTDGVIEARRDGVLLGVDGLSLAIADAGPAAEEVAEAIELAVIRHSGGRIGDDAAALVLRALPTA